MLGSFDTLETGRTLSTLVSILRCGSFLLLAALRKSLLRRERQLRRAISTFNVLRIFRLRHRDCGLGGRYGDGSWSSGLTLPVTQMRKDLPGMVPAPNKFAPHVMKNCH